MTKIIAPWSDDIVERLNYYQQIGYFHPYTCGNDKCNNDLLATNNGWVCDCGYIQDWALEPCTMQQFDDIKKMYSSLFKGDAP